MKVCIYPMPHEEVREKSLTTRLRMVFDAPSHAPVCKTLKDCLETRPNLNHGLLEVRIRFRWLPVALIADIEKAFLQIRNGEQDRNIFRFLWFKENPTERIREEML